MGKPQSKSKFGKILRWFRIPRKMIISYKNWGKELWDKFILIVAL